MKRTVNALVVSTFCLITAVFSFSQSPPDRQPCPDVNTDALGCELIAWSRLQAPVPLPLVQERQPADQANENLGEERATAGSVKNIAGVILKNAGQYYLRTGADEDLLLDDQKTAQNYDGKRVTVTGRVDAQMKRLHIESIVPTS
jgi:hypothetical protein